jgi:hypothetical protein
MENEEIVNAEEQDKLDYLYTEWLYETETEDYSWIDTTEGI